MFNLQWATKVLRHLVLEFDFLPSSQNNVDFSISLTAPDHSAYTTLNWGVGGIRELTLDANKIEQLSK